MCNSLMYSFLYLIRIDLGLSAALYYLILVLKWSEQVDHLSGSPGIFLADL